MTLGDLIRIGTDTLSGHSKTPRLDAEYCLADLLQISRSQLFVRAHDEAPAAICDAFQQMIAKRETGVPIAYLLGSWQFREFSLKVSPATLIPRPETEELIDIILAECVDVVGGHLVDLGTGTGAIAIALAKARPDWHVLATDASWDALCIAAENIKSHQAKVNLLAADWGSALATYRFDILISNPPYIPKGDPHCREGDLRFEPVSALVSGDDGLDAIRLIVTQAAQCLKSGGYLLLEHGFDQAESVKNLLKNARFTSIKHHRDSAGKCRFISGRQA
jgi:release factor glutamine methyltransferase